MKPALESSSNYGTVSIKEKKNFLHATDSYINFLKSTKFDLLNSTVKFEVNNDLFKGFLLAPHQIKATSKMRDKVAEVEKTFIIWLHQMQSALCQGNQIRRDPSHVGPAKELEYWRSMYTKYTNILEFTASRPFKSYFLCLKLSKSKLLKVNCFKF